MLRWRSFAVATLLGLALSVVASTTRADDLTQGLQKGNPDIQSAGPLAFGPEGILFIGDTRGAAVFAIATGDTKPQAEPKPVKVAGIGQKIADLLGTKPQEVQVNDLAVNPISGRVYLSVSRGRGPDAAPVVLRVGSDGKLEEVALKDVPFSRVLLPNPPDAQAQRRGQSLRAESITDLAYTDSRLFVAGLSNEEFSSRLIAVPVPFQDLSDGASIEFYHGSHGRFETTSPVRTFVATEIGGQPHLLAAYTCTPLVKVPLSDLKPGAHVKGTTIAELGNHNRPLDMITYDRNGQDYLLMANNSRGVMKVATAGADQAESITRPVPETKGLPYETIQDLKGVVQLDKLGESQAVLLIQDDAGTLSLETIDLP